VSLLRTIVTVFRIIVVRFALNPLLRMVAPLSNHEKFEKVA